MSAAQGPLLAVGLALLTLTPFAEQRQRRPSPADAARDDDGRGALAVLRRDGFLVPIASFDRDSWRVTWPIDLRSLEIPATREAIPRDWWGTRSPNLWRAYLTNGDAQFLELEGPSVVRSFCGPRFGIRTTYRSQDSLPPVPVDPFPKDGLAISGGVPLEPIETVSPASTEGAAMVQSLVDEFNRVEDTTIAGVRSRHGWRHPFDRDQRRLLPVRLESWYRSPSGDEPGWTVSYVEAVRQYPPGPADKGCGLETLVSGWVHHRDGQLMKRSQLRGKVTYCDRVGATYMLPFGRIRPKNQTYWVFQLSGWETEWYEVVAVRPEKIRYVLEVFAGGKARCAI